MYHMYLGMYLEKTIIQKGTCTSVFVAALFTIAKTWKQPKCSLTEEWVKKMWYIYTMEYSVQFSSVAQLCPTLCDPMNRSTPGLPVHHPLPEFTQTQCPSSWWCHPAISSSVGPFSSCPQSLPASGSFPMSQCRLSEKRKIFNQDYYTQQGSHSKLMEK